MRLAADTCAQMFYTSCALVFDRLEKPLNLEKRLVDCYMACQKSLTKSLSMRGRIAERTRWLAVLTPTLRARRARDTGEGRKAHSDRGSGHGNLGDFETGRGLEQSLKP
jgi:hypothetical protein